MLRKNKNHNVRILTKKIQGYIWTLRMLITFIWMDPKISVYASIDKLNMFITFNQIALFFQYSIPSIYEALFLA